MKTYVKEIGQHSLVWTHLAEAVEQWLYSVNTVLNLRAPYKAGNFSTP